REFLDYWMYIFRGHTRANWRLESTLDRLLRSRGALRNRSVRGEHYNRFLLAARGRRGPNPPYINEENGWWALGQHNGLATPLLDWTESPFVALFFAFEEIRLPATGFRAVWALHVPWVEEMSESLIRRRKRTGRRTKPSIVQVYRPMSDENARLVSQRGLFTRGPNGVPLEDWVRQTLKGNKRDTVLIKLQVPNVGRNDCLRFLNRMNINHLSLFPDMYGASRFCNFDLLIDLY
ncbi:MAG TPA: FRG domain-containing protein, partial [bacterium]|nr:FRG domain-containing protein [bacterium]